MWIVLRNLSGDGKCGIRGIRKAMTLGRLKEVCCQRGAEINRRSRRQKLPGLDLCGAQIHVQRSQESQAAALPPTFSPNYIPHSLD